MKKGFNMREINKGIKVYVEVCKEALKMQMTPWTYVEHFGCSNAWVRWRVSYVKHYVRTITVGGKEYKVWSDSIAEGTAKGTFVEAEDGTVTKISDNAYMVKIDFDRCVETVREAIEVQFKLDSFRK